MLKKILPCIISYLFIFVSTTEAQPNNFQCSPQIISLDPATPCTSLTGTITAPPKTISGTTANATNDSLSGAITTCYTGSAALKDVWYQFTANETHVDITISTGTLKDPYVAIYESANGECVGLMPRDCFTANGTGLFTMTFGPLTYGVKYYLQIASTSNINGTFNLILNSKNNCADCMKNSILQAYPLPVQAAYPPDTIVGFCYSVIGYKELYGNRLHGVVPVFGNGWDIASFKVVDVADSADLKGEWKYFKNINIQGSTVNGFFYDVGNDNNPTNNLGDEGNVTTIWTFCFTIKTKNQTACSAGQNNLSIEFNTYSDNESGSLISIKNCSADKEYMFKAHTNCCPKASAGLLSTASCDKSADGKIIAFGGASIFGYTYELYNSTGIRIDKLSIPPGLTPYTNNTLSEGNYYLYISSNSAGACETAINVYVPGPISYYIQQTSYGCGTGCNSAKVTVTSGNVLSHKWSNGSIGATPSSLCPGMNYDTMSVAPLGTCKIVDSIFIFNLPLGSPNFKYGKIKYCTAESVASVSNFPTTPGGIFTIADDQTNSATINANTGAIALSGITTSGRIIVKYHTGVPCNAFAMDTVFIELSPPAVNYTNRSICVGSPNAPFLNASSNYYISWYSGTDINLTNPIHTQNPSTSYDPLGGTTPLPGTYTYLVTQKSSATSLCKSVATTVTITVYSLPTVDAGSSVTICPGFGINLVASGASSYAWQPLGLLNDATLANPVASPTETISFTVTGTDASGCAARDTVTIFVSANGKCNLVIYNGFTPNDDTHNDFWYIDGIGTDEKNEVSIFNRWGEKLWETKHYDNQNNKWEGQGPSGKILPDGTYFYLIKYKEEIFKGWVELTR